MARPAAEELLSHTDDVGTEWQILAADAYYVITYKGRLVNIRTYSHMTILNPPKYKKIGYPNRGSCLAAVRKLNLMFQTTDFGYTMIGDIK